MKKRDKVGWEMLLRLLLEDIEGMERDRAEKDEGCPECGHSDGYLLDDIDENFKGKATNGYGVEIDFDKISMLEDYNELMDMDRRLDKERRETENIDE